MEKCFAYRLNKEGQYECSALQENCDGCKFGCKFYKTVEQRQKELLKDKEKHKNVIDNFTLLIDGVKHGEFDSIVEADLYLQKFYDYNKQDIEPVFKYMQERNQWLSEQDIDKVMYTHTVRLLYKKEA